MKTSDETLLLIRDLVGKTAGINQLSFSRLLSHWKRRFATVLQKENAVFILNSSSHVLFAINSEPNCEPNLGETEFSTWRASIVLNWLSLYSNSLCALFVCNVCMTSIYLHFIQLSNIILLRNVQKDAHRMKSCSGVVVSDPIYYIIIYMFVL